MEKKLFDLINKGYVPFVVDSEGYKESITWPLAIQMLQNLDDEAKKAFATSKKLSVYVGADMIIFKKGR